MKPQFQHPIEPFALTQGWGTYDPKDYSQFGFTRHNGLDMVLSPNKHIVAPCDGTVVRVATKENGLWQPNGGGVFVGIVSEPMDFPAFTNTTPDNVAIQFAAGTYRTLVDLLHLENILVSEGDEVKAGQLVAIGDNTGFTTGPHCHSQWRRITWNGGTNYTTVDVNDANDSFDPTQFFPPTSFHYTFMVNLAFGQTSVDITNLQKALTLEGVFPATQPPTGNYLGITAKAVLAFRLKYGVSSTTDPKGYSVGPLTRAKLNSLYSS